MGLKCGIIGITNSGKTTLFNCMSKTKAQITNFAFSTGKSNIGICNFVDTVVDFCIMFSMLGITVVGVREIATAKGNREELDRTFSSLLSMNAVSSLLAAAALSVAVPGWDRKQCRALGVPSGPFRKTLNWRNGPLLRCDISLNWE